MELWLSIPGFNGYEVSSIGNVKSSDKNCILKGGKFVRKGKILKSSNNGGYRQVVLYANNITPVTIKVHRLVALAFIPNPENKETVNHKNGIKNDNRVENLEWATRSENTKHKYIIGIDSNKGTRHPNSKLTEKDVLKIRTFTTDIKTRISLSIRYGVSTSHIFSIQTRKSWKHI